MNYFSNCLTVEGVRAMYCEDCGEIVDADMVEDIETGYKDYFCPVNREHELFEAKNCASCGEKCKDTFCISCRNEIVNGWKKILLSLPDGADEYEVSRFIGEELL